MPLEPTAFLAADNIPDIDDLPGRRNDALAVGAERDAAHTITVPESQHYQALDRSRRQRLFRTFAVLGFLDQRLRRRQFSKQSPSRSAAK